MRLLRQTIFSENKLSTEKKKELLDKIAASSLVLGGMGTLAGLSYLTNKGNIRNVPKTALAVGILAPVLGFSTAAWAKHKKDKLQKENEVENKERKSSR